MLVKIKNEVYQVSKINNGRLDSIINRLIETIHEVKAFGKLSPEEKEKAITPSKPYLKSAKEDYKGTLEKLKKQIEDYRRYNTDDAKTENATNVTIFDFVDKDLLATRIATYMKNHDLGENYLEEGSFDIAYDRVFNDGTNRADIQEFLLNKIMPLVREKL